MRQKLQSLLSQNRLIAALMLLFFLICFCHSLLRNMKDALVITSNGVGAEVIPFIQVWMLLPATLCTAALFTYLLKHFSQERVFYVVVGSFLAFFLIFTVFIFPYRDQLQSEAFAEKALNNLPRGLHGLVGMLRIWSFSLFYVVCELWAAFVTPVLFWGFINAISSFDEAKKGYGLIMLGGNLGTTAAGFIGYLTSYISPNHSVYALMLTVLAAGLAILTVYHQTRCKWLSPSAQEILATTGNHKRNRNPKLTFKQAVQELVKSRYLSCIAVMVIGYNLVLNLGELLFKDQLREIYPDFHTYNAYLGYTTTAIGLLSSVLALAVPYLMKHRGWTFTALICPISLLVSGCAFFGILLFHDQLPWTASTTTTLTVFWGAIMYVMGRSTKHSVFDASKDMAYIPLDPEIKLKSKAVIDGVGSRFGKSSASGLYQGLLLLFSTLTGSAPIVGIILLVTLVAWILGVRFLGWHLDEQRPQTIP